MNLKNLRYALRGLLNNDGVKTLDELKSYYSAKAGLMDLIGVCTFAFLGTAFTGSIFKGFMLALLAWIYGMVMLIAGIDRANEDFVETDFHMQTWEEHFHHAWGIAKERPDYDKEAWIHVQRYMESTQSDPLSGAQARHFSEMLHPNGGFIG